jgi:NAD(P)-dependent dehydrogenase (short-subunit alcohol dehydrogenase family)
MMKRLDSKTALITGGNSGIGRATALLFAREGAHVMIAARDRAKADAALAQIRAEGGQATFIACDVRDPESCAAAVEAANQAFGGVDILFNNAGIVPYGTLVDTPPEVWLDAFATNVHGTYYMSRAVLPGMIARRSGVIINNGSDWAVVGGQGATAYCATKGAVAQITRSLALDYARDGIRVNAICPGDTYVDRWRENWRLQPGQDFEEVLRDLGDTFPMGRVGSVDEIARGVLFLASDDSSYMTGQLLVIDGGNTAGGASTRY